MKKLILLLALLVPLVGSAQTNYGYIYESQPGTGITPWYQGSADAGDLNGDGFEDFVRHGVEQAVPTPIFNSFIVLNNGDGSWTEIGGVITDTFDGEIIIDDFDNDGDLDVFNIGGTATTTSRDPESVLYLNDGNGNFTTSSNFPASDGLYKSSAVEADIDNSGNNAIITQGSVLVGGIIFRYFRVYQNINGVFTKVFESTLGLSDGEIRAAHLNGDNLIDFIISGQDGSGAKTRRVINDGNFDFTITDVMQPVVFSSTPLGDIDGDSDIDALVFGSDQPNRYGQIWTNDGNANFSFVGNLPELRSAMAELIDARGNGTLGLILTGELASGAKYTKFLDNDGNGNFTPLLHFAPLVDDASIVRFANGDVIISGNTTGIPVALDFVYLKNIAGEDYDGDGTPNGIDSNPQDPCSENDPPGYVGYDPDNPIWQAADCDGDGYSNIDEHNAETDPYDPTDFPMSVSEFDKDLLVLYPNPTSGIVNIKADSSITIEQIGLHDMTGRLIFQTDAVNSIDMSQYASGIYLLKFISEQNTTQTYKIIKQ